MAEIHCDNSKIVISKFFVERFEREATDLLELIKTMNIEHYGKYDTIQTLIDSFSGMKKIEDNVILKKDKEVFK